MSKCDFKLQSNFIEITLRHGFSPVNLLHIFRTPFSKNTSGGCFLKLAIRYKKIVYAVNFESLSHTC